MRSIELFAGAGGLGIGLHEAGFKPDNVIERDLYCCDTIRQNQGLKVEAVKDWNVLRCDVRTIDFEEYEGKVDLVCGGPSCSLDYAVPLDGSPLSLWRSGVELVP